MDATAALGVSGDGNTVVGYAASGALIRAFRWQGPGTIQSLGVLSGYPWSYAEGASGDGSVVVGRSQTTNGLGRTAFRWTGSGGMQSLGYTRPNSGYSDAAGVSRDGNAVVGISQDVNGFADAFLWTTTSGMHALPQLPGTPIGESYATAVNFDGSIVVGVSGAAGTGVMWRNGQVSDLGITPGWIRSIVHAVNDDGTVAAGYLFDNFTQTAAVWTPERGMEPLIDYLAASGVPLPAGLILGDCFAVSADGRTFAGVGGSAEIGDSGWVATVPAPSTLLSVTAFGGIVACRNRRRQPIPLFLGGLSPVAAGWHESDSW